MEPINDDFGKMRTITIYRFGTDADFWNLIINLYDHEGLMDDDWWHVFWEDEEIRLRVSDLAEIPGALDERGIQYDIDDYDDDHPVVREFFHDFLALFNTISVFHVHVYKAGGWLNTRQVQSVTDRMVHAFFNMGWGSLAELQAGYEEGVFEAKVLGDCARGRAFHAGTRYMYKRQQNSQT